MEKNNKISYLLEIGNNQITDFKAKHRETKLFDIENEDENVNDNENEN